MPPALHIPLDAVRRDPALASRGTRKFVVNSPRAGSEREAVEAVWSPEPLCPVLVSADTEASVFNERAQQDRHYHRRGTEIYILIEGVLTIEVERIDHVLRAGDMLVVNPGARHLVKPNGPFLCRAITSHCGGESDKFIV